MNTYYLIDRANGASEMHLLTDDASAFRLAQNRNRRYRGANWKAFDERGCLIVGIRQMNDAANVEYLARA